MCRPSAAFLSANHRRLRATGPRPLGCASVHECTLSAVPKRYRSSRSPSALGLMSRAQTVSFRYATKQAAIRTATTRPTSGSRRVGPRRRP